MSNIKMEPGTVIHKFLDELDEVSEESPEADEKPTGPGEIKTLNLQVEALRQQNQELRAKSEKLEEKNQKLGEQVKRLHEAAKKNADQILNSGDQIDKLEDEIESLQKRLSLAEKELEMYKKKLRAEEAKNSENSESKGKFEQMLEDKNKRIISLETQLANLQIASRKSIRRRPEPENSPTILVKSAVSIQKNEQTQDLFDRRDEAPAKGGGLQIDDDSLPLELRWDIADLKKKQRESEGQQNLTPKGHDAKKLVRRKSQRDAMKDLNKIDFGIKSARKRREPSVNPFEMFDKSRSSKSHYAKRKNLSRGVNSKIFEKSKQLKIVIQKPENKFGESSKKKKLVYSYDHLNIINNQQLIQIIEKHENIFLKSMSARINFRCLSDNVYRLNKWKNKKPKILVITSRFMYIITPPHDVKRVLRLSEIEKIYTRGRQDNFMCFFTKTGNDEMLDYFKKNELLLYITGVIKKRKLDIKIRTDVESFNIVTTENKKVSIDPNKLEKFKPIYNNTFNFASERDRLMNIFVWKKGFFGVSEGFERRVALITDMGILLFSSVKWDLEKFVPFGGSPA